MWLWMKVSLSELADRCNATAEGLKTTEDKSGVSDLLRQSVLRSLSRIVSRCQRIDFPTWLGGCSACVHAENVNMRRVATNSSDREIKYFHCSFQTKRFDYFNCNSRHLELIVFYISSFHCSERAKVGANVSIKYINWIVGKSIKL